MEVIEEVKTNFSNIHNEIKHKLKLPIIITYSVVLLIYNWDILFYLAFESNSALKKIQYVKLNFFTENFERIWKPILYSILYSILFPFLQVLINQVVQFFKIFNSKITRKEEIDNAIHSFNIQQQLSGKQSLQQLQNRIDQLLIEKETLISTNNSLLSQIKNDSNETLNSNSILNSEYDKSGKELFKEVDKFNNEEKSTFLELISFLDDHSDSFTLAILKNKSSYPQHTQKTHDILLKYNVIANSTSTGYFKVSMFGSKFIKFFKSKYIK